jgi:hypothetical protein
VRAILGQTLTDDLAAAMDAAVRGARESIATDADAVTPRQQRAARRTLRTLAKKVMEVRSMLEGDSYPSWKLLSVLDEIGVRGEALGEIRRNLSRIGDAATAAQGRTGTYTVRAVQDASGRFPITEATWVLEGRAGRPREDARFILASSVGLALERHGARITKTRDGVYERVVRALLREAGLYEPTDLHRLVIRSVTHVRWLLSRSR